MNRHLARLAVGQGFGAIFLVGGRAAAIRPPVRGASAATPPGGPIKPTPTISAGCTGVNTGTLAIALGLLAMPGARRRR
jgi:hypothetical protein